MRSRVVIAAVLAMTVTAAGAPSRSGAADGSLTGDWSGDSVCLANRETCHDEKALYHLTGPNEHNVVTVIGSKIVDGREIVMGPPSDFRFDPEKKTLTFESRYGVFRFTVTGTAMDGTLTLPSGVLLRRITLKKTAKAGAASVTTSQYDDARTGATLTETVLTPRNVNAAGFGKIAALPVDGDVYAQPLVVPNVDVPGKGAHDLVFVATEHDSVYAFDASGSTAPPLWHTSFLDARRGVTAIPNREVLCPFIKPEVGITPTPVIDLASGTLYVLARTREAADGEAPRYVQRLHALDLHTGAEKSGGPVVIAATADGSGAGARDGKLAFDPLRENPRASLLLTGGTLYLTWASSCDVGPYHGWVMAYDAHSLRQLAAFVTSPNADDSGIWQGDTGPAADAAGNVFVATGNGAFDAARGGHDYGDSILRLTRNGNAIAVRDYFTPSDEAKLNSEDGDLGSGGPLLLPDQPGPHRRLLLVGGKGGGFYVVDRDAMGGFRAGANPHAVQVLDTGKSIFGAAAYWNGHVFALWSNDVLEDFALRNGRLGAQPVARGTHEFIDPGATPSVSANGNRDGIVWVIETRGWRAADRPAVLRAYDASNVARELYDTEQRPERDRAGTALRFTIPTVANGRVYAGAKGELDVYGLVSSRPAGT